MEWYAWVLLALLIIAVSIAFVAVWTACYLGKAITGMWERR